MTLLLSWSPRITGLSHFSFPVIQSITHSWQLACGVPGKLAPLVQIWGHNFASVMVTVDDPLIDKTLSLNHPFPGKSCFCKTEVSSGTSTSKDKNKIMAFCESLGNRGSLSNPSESIWARLGGPGILIHPWLVHPIWIPHMRQFGIQVKYVSCFSSIINNPLFSFIHCWAQMHPLTKSQDSFFGVLH